MPCSRVVDLAAHENGTGSVAEGARFVMRVRMRVIFVVSGRRHFCFIFVFILFYCLSFFGVFDEMLVGWLDWYIDDDDDVSSWTGLGWL